MTKQEIEESVLKAVTAATAPISGISAVFSAAGLEPKKVSYREVDRALQALRRVGRIRYLKSTGQKGSHGWVAAPAKTKPKAKT